MFNKEDTTRTRLEEKIKNLETELLRYKQALSVIKELDQKPTIKIQKDFSNTDSLFAPEESDKQSRRRLFLFEIVEKILRDENRPLSSRDIMNKVNEYNQNAKYDFSTNWSGTFSQAYRKPKSNIKQYKIQDVPAELSAFYGLKEWFQDEEIKSEFREKIKSSYGV